MPWFGPPMSPASMATARFMETWAHALDVYDALGIEPEPTDRIRHVAHLGVRTRDFAFSVHELPPPAEEFRSSWSRRPASSGRWGPEDAAQTVTGSAYDFCLLVTQRVHRDDTDLVAAGADAEQWLTIAQAFAGPRRRGAAERWLSALRIGNCSGFYGDRLSAMREMLEGGAARRPHRRLPGRADHADPRQGHDEGPVARLRARPSSARSRTASASRSSSGVKIVSNAGGLNPAGLADRLREVAQRARPRPGDRPRRGRRRARRSACATAR